RVLILQSGYGLNRMRTPEGLNSCLREAEMFHLPLLDEVFHRAGHIFDGHIRVHAVLIQQVDRAVLRRFSDPSTASLICSGRLFRRGMPLIPRGSEPGLKSHPNFVAIT